MDTRKPWLLTFSAIPPHTQLSIDSLHQPTSKYTKRVGLNSFRVYVTFSSPTDTRKPWPPTFSAIPPHNRLSIHSLCQPTSKCMKRVRLNSFCVSVTFSSPTHTQKPKAANTISHTPSYLTFHQFPASTHLQMHETSSVELVSCFRNLFQPYGYTKCQGRQHSQPYTLIPDFPSIPCVNPPPKARKEFVRTRFVFL